MALAWRLIALGLLGQLAGECATAIYDWLGPTPYPSLADPLYLSFYPLMLAALLVLPAARQTRSQRLRLTLDLTTTALGTATVLWYVLIEPTARAGGQSAMQMGFSLAYPVGDAILVFGVASLLLRGVPAGTQRALWFVTAALCLFVVGDVSYAYVTLHGGYEMGDTLTIAYVTAFALFILAARCQVSAKAAAPALAEPVRSPRVSWVPYIAVAASFAVLIISEIAEGVSGMLVLVIAVDGPRSARERPPARGAARARRRPA